jgi:hypothetical protein
MFYGLLARKLARASWRYVGVAKCIGVLVMISFMQIGVASASCDAGSSNALGSLLATNPAGIKNSTNPSDTAANEALLASLSGRPAGSVNFLERIDNPQGSCTSGAAVDVSVSSNGSSGSWKSDQKICFVLVKAGSDKGNSGGGISIYQYPNQGVFEGGWSTSTLGNKGLSHIDFYTCDAVPESNQGTIQFKKVTKSADLSQKIATPDSFTFKIGNDEVATLNTINANPASSSVFTRDAGADYEVTEEIVNTNGWEFETATCERSQGALITSTNLPIKIEKLAAGESVVCTFTNKATGTVTPAKGSIQIEKIAELGEGSFTFSVKRGGTQIESPVVVTTGGIGFSSVIGDLDPANYSVTEAVPEGWTLTGSSCRGRNERVIVNTSAIDLQQGENVVCTFFNKKKKDDKAEDVTKLYVNRRVDNLLSHGPDRARLLRRLDQQQQQESLKDGPSTGEYEPLKITGSIDGTGGEMKFSTSLSQLRSAAVAAANAKLTDPSLSFQDSYSGHTPYGLTQRLDLWVEGQITAYYDSLGGINREGDFKILYVGMDYAISPGFLIGALVQIDRTDESIKDPDLKGTIDGTGWMAGPYLGIKLRDNLFFDARAAWGQSTNDLDLTDDVVGKRTGSFDTDRWLASATLTGNYHLGALRISPQIGIAYGNETSDAYRTSLGQDVGAVDVTIGRLTFGPEFGYTRRLEDGTLVEPHASIKGIWSFDQETLDLSTGPVEPDEFRAQIEAGILIKTPDGYSVRAAGSYDGIGDKDLEAWSAKAWLNVPLN